MALPNNNEVKKDRNRMNENQRKLLEYLEQYGEPFTLTAEHMQSLAAALELPSAEAAAVKNSVRDAGWLDQDENEFLQTVIAINQKGTRALKAAVQGEEATSDTSSPPKQGCFAIVFLLVTGGFIASCLLAHLVL